MSPSEYKTRYEKMMVSVGSGGPEIVSVNQYRRRNLNYNEAAAKDFFNALARHGVDTVLRINTAQGQVRTSISVTEMQTKMRNRLHDKGLTVRIEGVNGGVSQEATNVTDWRLLARYVFAGKGSPEACQVVLQLARYWNLPGATNLQAYADSALGLDCNGFVGNYIWHEFKGHPWYELGVGNLDMGPDLHIHEYFKGRKAVKDWDGINTAKSHILGLVDSAGDVMPGSSADPGHVVISEPGPLQPRTLPDGTTRFAIRVIECTAAHNPGLWDSWYTTTSNPKGGPLFKVDREDMTPNSSRFLRFKMVEL